MNHLVQGYCLSNKQSWIESSSGIVYIILTVSPYCRLLCIIIIYSYFIEKEEDEAPNTELFISVNGIVPSNKGRWISIFYSSLPSVCVPYKSIILIYWWHWLYWGSIQIFLFWDKHNVQSYNVAIYKAKNLLQKNCMYVNTVKECLILQCAALVSYAIFSLSHNLQRNTCCINIGWIVTVFIFWLLHKYMTCVV